MNHNDQAIEDARKFLEDILSFFGLNAVVSATSEDGETLRALQAMVSTMLKNKESSLYRVNIDIADYKKQRANHLLEQLATWVEKLREQKTPYALQPMNGADRRTIHRGLDRYADVKSHSEGEFRDRHIVLELSDTLSK